MRNRAELGEQFRGLILAELSVNYPRRGSSAVPQVRWGSGRGRNFSPEGVGEVVRFCGG